MVFCFGSSWLFHAVYGPLIDPFAALDHVGIFVLIAGTCTPIALVVLRGGWRSGLLGMIWLLALIGIVVRLTVGELPRTIGTSYYLVMGWIGVVTYFELARQLGHSRLILLWLGGLFYSVGAGIHLVNRPVLVPGIFEAHELFHLFVMAGSLCHYYFMLVVVAPYRRPAVAVPVASPVPVSALSFPASLAQHPVKG
jgi:hemolysin III